MKPVTCGKSVRLLLTSDPLLYTDDSVPFSTALYRVCTKMSDAVWRGTVMHQYSLEMQRQALTLKQED